MKFDIRTEQDRQAFIGYVKKASIGKTVYTAEFKRYVKPRSLSQNKLMWFWHTLVQVETGNDRVDVHEFVKARFLPKKEIVVMSQRIMVPRSTTSLNNKQFTWLLEKYHAFMAEQDILLPWPDENGFEQLFQKYKDWI